MRLILLRHAQTLANENGICQGISNTNLTNDGARSSYEFNPDLNGGVVIITSPLQRCFDSLINIRHDHDMYFDKNLMEQDLGVLEGSADRMIFNKLVEQQSKNPKFYAPDLRHETLHEVGERCKQFIKNIQYYENDYETMVVCSHGTTLGVLQCILDNKPIENYLDYKPEHLTPIEIEYQHS